jgi:hypothetical protein
VAWAKAAVGEAAEDRTSIAAANKLIVDRARLGISFLTYWSISSCQGEGFSVIRRYPCALPGLFKQRKTE